jgi:hypothetical protein
MNPERQHAAHQCTDGRNAQDHDQPVTDAGLPWRWSASQPLVTEQGANQHREADVLQRDRCQSQDAEETFVHHFT